MMRARRELQFLDSQFQKLLTLVVQHAEGFDLVGTHVAVEFAVALLLQLPAGANAGHVLLAASGIIDGGGLAHGAQLVGRQARHFHDQVNAVEQGAGDLFQIALHAFGGAATAAVRVAVIAALAELRCLFAIPAYRT